MEGYKEEELSAPASPEGADDEPARSQPLLEDFEVSGSDSDSSEASEKSKSVKSGSDSDTRVLPKVSGYESGGSQPGTPASDKSGSVSPKHKGSGSDDSGDEAASAVGPRIEIPKGLISSDSDSEGSRPTTPKSNKSESIRGSPSPTKEASGSGSEESKPGTPKREDDEDENLEENEDAEVKMEQDEEPLPETRIDVEIPKITTDLGTSIHFIKLPNFLSVETRPFDPNTYEDEIDDEETLDEEGRARLKLKVENTMRWRERFNDKGVFVKESNARFVRWSDGSLSLHLGDEIFNVEKQALLGDHNHLFIRQGTGLQGQAVFRTKLTFRPHSTESFTHRKMTMSLADRSTKAQGIKVLSIVGADPEANRGEMIKKEEDKLRASVRRESKQRRIRERASTKGLSSSYLDDEYSDEDNSISISAIKNKYKKGGVRAHIYSSDEDEESDLERGRKLEKAKRLKDSEEEDDEERDDGGRSSPVESSMGGAPQESSFAQSTTGDLSD